MATRNQEIVKRIQTNIHDLAGAEILPTRILSEMFQVEVALCRRLGALQSQTEIDLVVGQTEYPLPDKILFLDEIYVPPEIPQPIKVIHDKITWQNDRRTMVGQFPRVCFQWGHTLFVHPAPTMTHTLGFLIFSLPTLPLTLKGAAIEESGIPENTVEPEIDLRYDKALELGTTANLLRDMKNKAPQIDLGTFAVDFEVEVETLRADEDMKPRAGGMEIQHSSKSVGF